MIAVNSEKGKRPVALSVAVDAVPEQLRAVPHWVAWRYVWKPPKGEAAGKWDKPPLDARTGRPASSTDPSTWSTFAEAVAAYRKGGYDGVGFVVHKAGEGCKAHGGGPDSCPHADNVVVLDLDKCRNAETGALQPWAAEIVEQLASYAEASPSGTGVRGVALGRKPAGRCRKGGFEVYESGRYVTITGQRFSGSPTAAEQRQEAVERIHARAFAAEKNKDDKGEGNAPKSAARRNDDGRDRGDDEIVILAERAANAPKFRALMAGDASGHGGDDSAADLALCCLITFYTRDAAQIERVFGRGKLADRAKWREREDYRKRTIDAALERVTEQYRPPRPSANGRAGDASGNDHGRSVEGERAEDRDDEHLTDTGNARRVVARHGRDLRYCHPWKCFLVWDGKRWCEDQTAEAVRRVKRTQADFYRRAARQLHDLGDVGDDPARKVQAARLAAELKHALKWEEAGRIAACLELVKSETGVPVLPEQLDCDPYLLNVENGTIDLRAGRLREHRREDLITKLAPVAYDPAAGCPLWLRFLRRIMADNDSLIRYLQRVVGYCLTGDVSEQTLWFLHGSGQNGKSTFLGVLLDMLGDYGTQAVGELLMAKDHESHPTERADLFGRRLVATIETEEGKRMAEALMKQLTGADRIKARRLYKDFFEFKPTHKLLLAANHKPTIRGTDFAVWRRIKLVPFTVTIPDGEKDKTLPAKLRAELPGVLAWAVQGCREWGDGGMDEPEEVRQATAEYQAEQDSVKEFLHTCCVLMRDARIKASVLHTAYIDWSGDKLMNPKAFWQRMKDNGYESKRQGTGSFYHGIGLPAREESVG